LRLSFSVHRSRDPRDLPPFPTRRSSDLLHAAADDARQPRVAQGDLVLDAALAAKAQANRAAAQADVTVAQGSQAVGAIFPRVTRSEEHTSELQSRENLVCRLLLEKKKRD